MTVDQTLDQRVVRGAIELACHAPSLHNSQPWRWLLGERRVELWVDPRRWLPATDTEGRDLVISCGAALHHLRVALAVSGVVATVDRVPDPEEPHLLAVLELRVGIASADEASLAAAITTRRTDRRLYGDWPVPDGFVAALVARAAGQGAVLRPLAEPYARNLVVAAMADAAAAQERWPGYRDEIDEWTGRFGSDDGVPPANLLRDAVGTGDGTARRLAEGTIEQPGSGTDGALLFALGTASDDRLSQVRAGEALSAVLLHATALGLATCPLSQPLEVDPTRFAVREQVLGGTLEPQLVLRIGWPTDRTTLPATPRRDVADAVELLHG